MTGPTLSALVVAHNEAHQLAACLDQLKFADELVVVLDRCTDKSAEIAHTYTDKILEGTWSIEGDRRNAGIDICTSEWTIEVDADERLPDELATEIRAAIKDAAPGYFLVPFDNYIGSRLVRYGWGASWGVSAAPRLFAKGMKRWGPQRIHPKLELKGPKRRLKTPMIHYVDRGLSDMILRLDAYTSARAADLVDSGDIGSIGNNVRRLFSRFFKCYVGRKGYREGAYGFLIAAFAALYPLVAYLKARDEMSGRDGPSTRP